MSEAKELLIVLMHETEHGLSYERESFTLSELGGVIPIPGDLITQSGVLQGLDRTKPENRRVYEVTRRYFYDPDTDDRPKLALVVKSRPGKAEEMEILLP